MPVDPGVLSDDTSGFLALVEGVEGEGEGVAPLNPRSCFSEKKAVSLVCIHGFEKLPCFCQQKFMIFIAVVFWLICIIVK